MTNIVEPHTANNDTYPLLQISDKDKYYSGFVAHCDKIHR